MAGGTVGRNVGGLDQTVRLAVGTALVMMWIFGPLGWWGALGLLPLVTGLTRVCPVYPLFGLNTCPAPAPVAPAPVAEAALEASGETSPPAPDEPGKAP